MENTQLQQNRPNDEIDLLELFSRMGKSISNAFKGLFLLIWRVVLFFISFSFKNIVQLSIIFGLGVALSVAIFFSSSRFYSSDMIASSNAIKNEDMISIINNLNELCRTGNKEGLAQNLSISIENAEKIKSIKAYWGYDTNLDGVIDLIDYEDKYMTSKDTTIRKIPNRFFVKAEVFDESIFNLMKSGLYKYIESNTYVIQVNETRKRQLQDMINQTAQEIRKLDSLQNFEYFEKDRITPQVGANQMVVFTEKERKLYHREIFTLISEKQELERRLTVYPDPVTIIQDFTPLSRVENSLMSYVKRIAPIILILGFIFMLVWRYKKDIVETIK
ncbi:MAG: hypothetical protein JW783_13350 [Bacteroidales bacterium]|nr:hypothetical protein [Bacteroidales bacterium]